MIKVACDRVTRKNMLRALSASIFIGAACLAFAADGGTHITVSGWVIDSACAYTKGLDKPIARQALVVAIPSSHRSEHHGETGPNSQGDPT